MSHPLALPSSQVGVPVNPFPSNPTLTHSTTSTINAPGSGGGGGGGAGAGAGGTAINTATSGYGAQVNLNPLPTAAQQKEPFAIKGKRNWQQPICRQSRFCTATSLLSYHCVLRLSAYWYVVSLLQ